MTFADQLKSARDSDEGEISSKKEAKRLAFCIFWCACHAASHAQAAHQLPSKQASAA